MQSPSSHKRVRSDSDESELNSLQAKKILLDILDESDVNSVTQDLDSFIKTFQDEISPPPEHATEIITESTTESTTELTESGLELGFLLEASDDELGLPPSDTNTGLDVNEVLTESVELSELWGLDDQISSYGSFEYDEYLGYEDVNVNINSYGNGEYVALDGLFDHTDVGFGSPEILRQPETLPAQ